MDEPNEIAGLLREIRDLLAGREQQYTDHLTRTRELYESQLAQSRQERERSIKRAGIAGGIFAGIAYAIYRFGL